jgi:protein-S-isoprenylcysteine O-methyltransferase Ste14
MSRDLKLLYGAFAYIVFVLTIAYSVAFFGNLFVARTIDAAAIVPFGEALAVNIGLLLLFGLQHSGMARQSFKRWLHARLSRCLERSTYVLASSIATIVVLTLWQPMGGVVWSVSNVIMSRAIYAFYFAGWGLMIYATFLIDHFEMFGLRQAWTAHQGGECWSAEFRTPGLYRHVRHPIYLGWLLIMWASPVMTVTHLVFAAGMTIYMLVGIQFEERDLAAELPDYQQYKRKVPMLLPSFRKRLLQESDSERNQTVDLPTL